MGPRRAPASVPRRFAVEERCDGRRRDAPASRAAQGEGAHRLRRLVAAQPAAARTVALPRARRGVVPALRDLSHRPVLPDLALRVGRPRGGRVRRPAELRRAALRRRLLHLSEEQRPLADPLHARDPRRPVHRAVPEPDRPRHPDLQVAVLLPLRDQPGRRRPSSRVFLRSRPTGCSTDPRRSFGLGPIAVPGDPDTRHLRHQVPPGLWPQTA